MGSTVERVKDVVLIETEVHCGVVRSFCQLWNWWVMHWGRIGRKR